MKSDESKYQKRSRRRKQSARRNAWLVLGVCGTLAAGTFLVRRRQENQQRLRQKQFLRAFHMKDILRRHAEEQEEIAAAAAAVDPQMLDNHQQGSNDKRPSDPSVGLERLLSQANWEIITNKAGGIRWVPSHLLPALPGKTPNPVLAEGQRPKQQNYKTFTINGQSPFFVRRKQQQNMAWEHEQYNDTQPPKVDYVQHPYRYPELPDEIPIEGGYPKLHTLGELMTTWPQDALDDPPEVIIETLLHFNYSDPRERDMALKIREAELPFKLYDVPEVTAAGLKWTDEYVSQQYNPGPSGLFSHPDIPSSDGQCQESPNNYFAFFTPAVWNVETMGLPPVRNNDWSFANWAAHARYADAVSLASDKPHFYWQAGVPRDERHKPRSKWTFVSRDLPSFSSPTETFFQFHAKEQKGIQCRFGERGVTAATHYDGGRNMVAMMTGAKRYVLSPPRECNKLAITTNRGNAIFRHSLLNFGHLQYLEVEEGNDMSREERAWLERARDSEAVDTVLKAGEVLYIPSHWFHYITSLQKSAQCNVRSGIDKETRKEFGSIEDVKICGEESG